VNIPLLYSILSVPHQLRNADYDFLEPRDAKDAAMELVSGNTLQHWPPNYLPLCLPLQFDEGGVDLADVISANRGVALSWKPMPPPHQPFWEAFFGILGTELLGMVPIAGPLLSAGFSIAWNAMTVTDGFVYDDPLALGFAVAGSVADSFKATRHLWADDVLKGTRVVSLSSSSSSKGKDGAARRPTMRAATVDEYARCLKTLRERDARAGIGPSPTFAARVPNADAARVDNKRLARRIEERRARPAQTGPPPTTAGAPGLPRIADAMLSAYEALQRAYEESMMMSTDNAEMQLRVEVTVAKPTADETEQKMEEVKA
jgi:hypothetical protein